MSNTYFEKIKSKEALAGYGATLITALVAYALSLGINGVVLATGTAIVGGLCGFSGGLIQGRKEAKTEL